MVRQGPPETAHLRPYRGLRAGIERGRPGEDVKCDSVFGHLLALAGKCLFHQVSQELSAAPRGERRQGQETLQVGAKIRQPGRVQLPRTRARARPFHPLDSQNRSSVSTGPLTVTLLNSSFYQDVQFTFTPGSVLSFQFVSTSNVDAVAPDAFTVAILDHTLSEIPTNNPNGLNSFLEVDLPSAGSGTQVTASSDTSGIGVTTMVTVVTPCDVSGNANANISDVQAIVNQALGASPPVTDVSNDGVVNVVDIQFVINAALGLGCPAS